MKLRKRVLSTALVGAMVFGSTVSFAANFDVKNTDTKAITKFDEYIFDDAKFGEIIFDLDKYLIEAEGKYYSAQEVVNATEDGTSLTDAIKNLTPVGDVTVEELKIESVSAINAETIEVTFNKSIESISPSDFDITGLQVKKADFKAQTDKKVVTLTTSEQIDQTYTLKYKGLSEKFIGISNLGGVLLGADKYEVEL